MPSIVKHKRRLHGYATDGRTFENLDLRSAQAFGSTWKSCNFVNCDFSAANLQNATFEDCRFDACSGTLANLSMCKLTEVKFINGTWEQAMVAVGILKHVRFEGVALSYASFAETLVTDLHLNNCNLHGTDLRFLEAFGVDFTGSNLWGAAISLGCQFFNGVFDEKQCQMFQALVARRYPVLYIGDRMRRLAGAEADLVDRLMRSDDEHE